MNINVTMPFLPPVEEYQAYINGIWKRNWLTNNGPLLNDLELKLKQYLGLDYLLYVANGTVALQIAIKALKLSGEIITTPFSYVATTSSIVWEGCEPVMVDIAPDTLNIDPSMIEAAITERTTAILATHVFGNPCDTEAIGAIAAKHGLKVIYDAAHAFGVRYLGKSLYAFGDVATASFHATKVFHTVEGGAVMAQSPDVLREMAMLRNFGHINATEFGGVGINAKNSEFHAAMGLCVLPYIDGIIKSRRLVCERYDRNLKGLPVTRPRIAANCDYNYAYYPVMLRDEATLLKVVDACNLAGIYPRRYFYPSLNNLPYITRGFQVPVSEDAARRILCLPLYDQLSIEEVDMISRVLHRALKYGL